MDDFLLRALAGGFGVAIIAGPLGSFVVWRRMAFFGDTLAHSALLGVALGIAMGTGPNPGIILVCTVLAAALAVAERGQRLANDTVLGIMSHGALALGLVALAFVEAPGMDVMAYLVGDILAVDGGDILTIYLGGAAVLAVLGVLWRPLLAATVDAEMAAVEGVPVAAVRLAFMVLLAAVVALAMKVVGILLVTALLIIPAAAARGLAATPESMAVMASAIGCTAVAGGLGVSFVLDAPPGPAVVVVALVLFVVSLAVVPFRR